MNEFFREIIVELRPIAYEGHPSNRVIIDYLAGRLKDEWRLSDMAMLDRLMKGELGEDRRLGEVSLHIMTCKVCAEKVARLREGKMTSRRDEPQATQGGIDVRSLQLLR